jgi:hypothetical protein
VAAYSGSEDPWLTSEGPGSAKPGLTTENPIIVAPKPPQGSLVRGHAGLVIKKLPQSPLILDEQNKVGFAPAAHDCESIREVNPMTTISRSTGAPCPRGNAHPPLTPL